MEGAAANHFVGDQPKPTLDLIEPGTASRREMEVETVALSGLEPALDLGALVSAVVVQNEMDVEFRRHLLFQLIEKPGELLAAMARQATADDLAVEDVEGGEQRRGSVPFVVMGLAFRQSWPQRQNGSRSVQRLNLALFIDA